MNGKSEEKRLLRRGIWALPLFLTVFALAAIVASRPVENYIRDLMMSSISPFVSPPDEIVLVTVNETTLAEFSYRSPIDRAFLASLISHIVEAGPKAIGVDILFDQPTEQHKDIRLERALQNIDVPVVLASAGPEDGLSDKQLAYLNAFAPDLARGLATLARDPLDGVVRELFTGRETDTGFVPGFAAALAKSAGIEPQQTRRAMVYYHGADSQGFNFNAYPAHTATLLPPQWFSDKYVLIGVDLPLDDRHPTPFIPLNGVKAGTLPGVMIHAHALAQFLSGDRIMQTNIAGAGILFLAGLILASWLAWRPFPVLVKPLLIFAVVACMWTASGILFAQWAIYIPVVAPSLLVAGMSGAVAFLAWKRDRDRHRFIKRAFSQYVSPAVVQAVIDHPQTLRLGGERRLVTCVFTDLQGFTSISEYLPPEQIAAILNSYLDRICNLFIDHGATIDKVIGDAVVGFFGAPVEQPDQADRAVTLALAIDGLSEQFRAEMARDGYRLGITRIGIHSGPAIVGNFGGERFFDYTAIGDTVNTAARLEGANKYIGTRICVSAAVCDKARNQLFRPSGRIYLKGKTKGIDAFEPLHDRNSNRSDIEAYNAAFQLMHEKDLSACAAFSRLASEFPDDQLVAFHRDRLERGETGADITLGEK
jgi:adenylate cyclase